MNIFDTHAHLDDEVFDNIRDKIIENSIKCGIKKILNPSAYHEKFEKIYNLTQIYDILYSSYGIHPLAAKTLNEKILKKIEDFIVNDPKCLAIGEIGLDFKLRYPDRKTQIKAFISQLELAKSLQLPVLIHSRRAIFKTYDLLKKYFGHSFGGIMHSFSGSFEMAEKFIELGFYISFSGSITFPNAKKPIENAKKLPLSKIVIETDSPDITPFKFKGEINKPFYITEILLKLSEIKNIPIDTIANCTFKNSLSIFYRKML